MVKGDYKTEGIGHYKTAVRALYDVLKLVARLNLEASVAERRTKAGQIFTCLNLSHLASGSPFKRIFIL